MKVLFLDIDGVLNSESYALKLEAKHHALGHTEPASPKRATTCDCFKLYHQIDRDAVARLNRIVSAAEAKIVVSSTWRKLFDLPELHRILTEHGLLAEIIGATPDGYEEPGLREMYGHPERMERGYEIDYWLKQHPEVDRFVILDDGSDMAMHGKRLVQTDSDEGLCDEHIELAIRVLAWDGASLPTPIDALYPDDLEDPLDPKSITSTRSNANADARRDFDGFDVNEELRRLRSALRDGRWRIAAELTANIDEHLCRGGSLPVAWFGPSCTQELIDHKARLRPSRKSASAMSREEQKEALTGYVDVPPAQKETPGSSVGIHCAHNQHKREGRCPESLVLERTTTVRPSHEDDYQEMFPAQAEAAVFLGWRLYQSVWWCPMHVVAMNLLCKRCRSACPACSCMGGPLADAVKGITVKEDDL